MRVAITSTSGQLGSATVTEIAQDDVVGLARTPAKAQRIEQHRTPHPAQPNE